MAVRYRPALTAFSLNRCGVSPVAIRNAWQKLDGDANPTE
jgi:hypothetical protein